MHIEYGPPGLRGVQNLQYLSDSEPDYTNAGLHQIARPVGLVGLAVWVYAGLSGNKKLKKQAFAITVAAFIVETATPR